MLKIYRDDYWSNENDADGLYLYTDNWDDFGHKTTCELRIKKNGERIAIGSLKIGDTSTQITDVRKINFDKINKKNQNTYISLGSTDYYINLQKLDKKLREYILIQLNDISFNLELLEIYKRELVVSDSFLRGKSLIDIKTRLHRLSHKKNKLSYEININNKINRDQSLSFEIDNTTLLPSNIQAIVGNNGVGKTKILKDLAQILSGDFYEDNDEINTVRNEYNIKHILSDKYYASIEFDSDIILEKNVQKPIENLIFVSFSPFDDFSSVKRINNLKYIGLDDTKLGLKENLNKRFIDLFDKNKTEGSIAGDDEKISSWNEVINNFSFDNGIKSFYDQLIFSKNKTMDYCVFDNLSSGQKILLLSLGYIIRFSTERTLVILDEPELFLHPPLITAYIRELSRILYKANSMCILTTHSPFVLQEIPNKYINIIKDENNTKKIIKCPNLTFGEEISYINDSIFGTDMRLTGYYNFLKNLNKKDVQTVLKSGQIGSSGYATLLSYFESEVMKYEE